jgi:hypothetical protein
MNRASSRILTAASLLVPASKRDLWWMEWRTELWYMRQSTHSDKEILSFCLGAFRDAFWLRRSAPREEWFSRLQSPASCIGFLAALNLVLALGMLLLLVSRGLLLLSSHCDCATYLQILWFRVSIPVAYRYLFQQELWDIYLTLMFACMIVPAVTRLHLGSAKGRRWRPRIRWYGFFLVKILLGPSAAYFFSFDLAHLLTANPEGHPVIQIYTCLAGFVLALRWAIEDQRWRCPDCLHLAQHPFSVGQRSSILLDRGFTEYLCPNGHGILRDPENWITGPSAQVWVSMDAGLFPSRF